MLRRLAVALVIVFTGVAFLSAGFDPGMAQTRQTRATAKKPGFFERLFGPRPTNQPLMIKRPLSSRTKKKPRRPIVSQPEVVETVEVAAKDPNARKILVIGDFVGGGVAWGLDQAFATEPKLVVVDKSNASSGFVRTDHYDWNKELLGVLNEEKPDIVIASFGVNDRQQMREGNARLAIRSEPWQATYTARIEGIAETLKVYGRPFFWVGAPPLRVQSAASDMAYLNGLYKPRVEGAGGHFIDIWIGFTNADGQYITTGPDIEGQVRALRTGDGINFTRAGKLKLSFYVEREVRRQTGIGAGAVDLLASASQTSQIEIGPDGKKRLVGPVISLSDPVPGASDTLAGAPPPVVFNPLTGVVTTVVPPEPAKPKPEEESTQYRLIVKGDPLASVAGRVDDFAWPPGQRAAQSFLAPEPDAPLAETAPTADADATLTPVSKSN